MATTNFSQLLGLALPTTGDLSGIWGEEVNNSITNLIDSAIAGTTTLTTDANVTLTTTNGAANQARNAIILCTGARTVQRTITAPAQSKAYIVINNTTGNQSVKLVGAGPTTGVVIDAGMEAIVAWNGSDFIKIASNPVVLTSDVSGVLPVANGGSGTATPSLVAGAGISIAGVWPNQTVTGTGGTVTSVAVSGGTTGLTTSGGPITGSGTITLAGTLAASNGGTGLASPGTNGNVLTSNGTAWVSLAPTSGGSQGFITQATGGDVAPGGYSDSFALI